MRKYPAKPSWSIDGELVVQARLDRGGADRADGRADGPAAVDPVQAVAAEPGEHGLQVGGGGEAEHLGLGQVDGADGQVGRRVQPAPVGERGGGGEQAGGGRGGAPAVLGAGQGGGDVGDLAGPADHVVGRGEVPGRGGAVQVAGVEGDQAAGGVEHVDDQPLVRVDVADRVGEHDGHAGGVGHGEHPPGQPHAAGGVAPAAVVDDLDVQAARRQGLLPAPEHGDGEVVAAGEHGPADLGLRPEQHGEGGRPGAAPAVVPDHAAGPRGVDGVGGHELLGGHGAAPGAAGVGGADQPAHLRPAGRGGQAGRGVGGQREDRDAGVARVDLGAAARRAATAPAPAARPGPAPPPRGRPRRAAPAAGPTARARGRPRAAGRSRRRRTRSRT